MCGANAMETKPVVVVMVRVHTAVLKSSSKTEMGTGVEAYTKKGREETEARLEVSGE